LMTAEQISLILCDLVCSNKQTSHQYSHPV